MATKNVRPRLSDEQLTELLGLVKGADSVELKVTVPDTAHRSAVRALGIDPLDVQVRQVFFFDTPDLRLNAAGVVARARRIQGRSGDTVVKLRPVVPAELPDDLRKSGSVNVEVDAMPGGYVCSASMKGKASNGEVLDVVRRGRLVEEAVHEGAARLPRSPRARGPRAGRSPRARPGVRAQGRVRAARATAGSSSRSCGSCRTARASWSCRRSARRPRRSRSRSRRAHGWSRSASTSAASRRPRRRARSSCSPRRSPARRSGVWPSVVLERAGAELGRARPREQHGRQRRPDDRDECEDHDREPRSRDARRTTSRRSRALAHSREPP